MKAFPITAEAKRSHQELHKHIRARGLISASALGLSDGLITNLAFLAGFAGAVSDSNIIRFAGTAAMLAGAVSMFFGGILAARSERDLFQADSRREAYEIQHEPDEEKRELTSLYVNKGLSSEEAGGVVNKIAADKQRWLRDMLLQELHLYEGELRDPFQMGAVIGASFLMGAFIPLTAYLLIASRNFSIMTSVAVSLLFLFFAGAWKGRIVGRSIFRSGIEMLLIGAVASIVLYLIGSALVFV